MAIYTTPFPDHNASNVRTLAEMGQFFRDNGDPFIPIELMDQDNTILDDIPWMEANEKRGHHTTLRTALPTPYWRRLYRGTPPSKSKISSIFDPVGKLEARTMVDAELLAMYDSENGRGYRLGEVRAHMEAMRQEAASALIYGNINSNPDGIHGLAPRYADTTNTHVIDAGGTGNNLTSMWLIKWGENDVHGIYANGTRGGLNVRDLGENDVLDDNARAFRAYQDLIEWRLGFSVRDWRSVVRVANIPTDSLLADQGEAGYVDLAKLMIIAKNKLPAGKREGAIWYVPESVMTGLQLQARDKGNIVLLWDQYLRSPNTAYAFGNPIRQVDAILETEEQLVAA